MINYSGMEKTRKYPRVLIIGDHMDLKSGGGITLQNLFKGWPLERIFFTSNQIKDEGAVICKFFYQVGFDETRRPWPFYKFQPYYESGEVILENKKKENIVVSKKSKYKAHIKKNIDFLMHFLGMYYYIHRVRISGRYIRWVKKINPDIVYAQPNVRILSFLLDFQKNFDIPMVLHFMDDWPNTMLKPGFSMLYWNGKKKSDLKKVIRYAEGRLSISETMGKEYAKRYGYDFVHFHNCIELEKWTNCKKKTYQVGVKFTVLYAGRIGKGTSNSVMSLAKAIEKLGQKNLNISFEIQTNELPPDFAQEIEKLEHTCVNPYIAYQKLPEKLCSADLLVLPMDFDKKNLDFIHLSMPTKVPEYMISGTPILVFAPPDTALSQYARAQKWAFIVNENSTKLLYNKIDEIVSNNELRKQYGQRAIELAGKYHNCTIIRENFRKYLNDTMYKRKMHGQRL